MKISDCPSSVSVAQRSEHRYVDSETMCSISGCGSQIFRIYKHWVFLRVTLFVLVACELIANKMQSFKLRNDEIEGCG